MAELDLEEPEWNLSENNTRKKKEVLIIQIVTSEKK